MSIAAVILNYNDAAGTIGAIKRINGFSCFSDIVVVDNASTDDSAARLKAAIETLGGFKLKLVENGVNEGRGLVEACSCGRLHFIETGRNGGYGYGNNAGVRYAYEFLHAELTVIANPDAVFDESLIEAMCRIFEHNAAAAVVGAVMHNNESHDKNSKKTQYSIKNPIQKKQQQISEVYKRENQRLYIELPRPKEQGNASAAASEQNDKENEFTYDEFISSGWMRRNTLQCMLNSGPISRRIFKSFVNYPESYYTGTDNCGKGSSCLESSAEVYAVHGSLLMVSTAKFTEIGGYDEEMFLYGEESVLAEKLYRKGYKTYLLKQGYEHAGSVSITGSGLKAVKRQQLRNTSENYYYTHYLDCDESGMNIVKLFQKVVLAETRIAAVLHLL